VAGVTALSALGWVLSRTALPRHQTLRAVVDWSWDLLDEPERVLLRRLSVFAGGATLETAEEVCGGRGLPRAAVLDLLARLVDRSLLEAAPSEPGTMWYRLSDTVRACSAERLAAAGERDAIRSAQAAMTWLSPQSGSDRQGEIWSRMAPQRGMVEGGGGHC
jgi:predicted ATPase